MIALCVIFSILYLCGAHDLRSDLSFSSVELSALFDLYSATNGVDWNWNAIDPLGHTAKWNFSQALPNPCSELWIGINCTVRANGTTQQYFVQELDLSGRTLVGTLPDSIGDFEYLSNFILYKNSIGGPIPASLCQLTNLVEIDFGDNRLTGSIPSAIGSLVQLATLRLNENDLTGHLPPSLFALAGLTILELSTNRLSGPLSPQVGNFTQITYLSLGDNLFSGRLPTTVGGMKSIQFFYVYECLFSGTLPSALGDLKNMESLLFDWNSFSGPIPATIGGATRLGYLTLFRNQLTGSLPDSIGLLSSLLDLYIYRNHLTGSIPDTIRGLTSLLNIEADTNLLSGTLPFELNTLRHLQLLQLYSNLFTGQLSDVFSRYSQDNLTTIDVSNNQLTGELPKQPWYLRRLKTFAASINCLRGSIPNEICRSKSLQTLALDGLNTAAACRDRYFPSWSGISSYGLQHDMLGGVPTCLLRMDSLISLHLAGNGLQGNLHNATRLGRHLTELALSNNLLTGEIPAGYFAHSWTNLDLSYNRISGMVPSGVPPQYGNNSIAIQVNRISGPISSYFVSMADVNMLNGNLFSCGWVNRPVDLPQKDPSFQQYQCGSNYFNQVICLWFMLAALAVAYVLFIIDAGDWRARLRTLQTIVVKYLLTVGREIAVLSEYQSGIDELSSALRQLDRFYSVVRFGALVLAAFALLVMLPVCAMLSLYYGTYMHTYAFQLSATLLSGVTATVVLIVCIALLSAVVIFFTKQFHIDHSSIGLSWKTLFTWQQALVFYINTIVAIVVNVGYVMIFESQPVAVVGVVQVLLVLFKTFWNDYVIRRANKWSYRDDLKRPSSSLGVVVAVFNTIVVPCIATALVSPDCFNNVITSPPKVTSTYTYPECSNINVYTDVCSSSEQITVTTYFNPPFVYNYQCSSTIVITYAPVFVLMFIMSTFLTPLAMWCWYQDSVQLPIARAAAALGVPGWWKVLPKQERKLKLGLNLLTTQVVVQFAVIITFGMIFPVLAVLGYVCVVRVTYRKQFAILRLLKRSEEEAASDRFMEVQRKVVRQIRDVKDVFVTASRIVAPVATIFYCCLVFDTLGDDVGAVDALWAPCMVAALPVSLVGLSVLYDSTRVSKPVLEDPTSNLLSDQL